MPRNDIEEGVSERALSRIAGMLDCTVEDLRSGDGEPWSVRGASELLGLWNALKTDADRARLLDFAHELAGA